MRSAVEVTFAYRYALRALHYHDALSAHAQNRKALEHVDVALTPAPPLTPFLVYVHLS